MVEPLTITDDSDPLSKLLLTVIQMMGLILVGPVSAAAAAGELFRQQGMITHRPTLLGPGDIGEARRRLLISTEEFSTDLARAGYTDRAIGVIEELTETLFSASEAIALWRRDEISEGALDSFLGSIGYKDERLELIKKLAFDVPGPGDVIRFVVREVFSPELRAELELDSEFPENAIQAFRAAGLDEDFSRDSWAAHWQLPSTNLAFEMFHRKQISLDDVRLILRANDVLPRFRESIIAVAHNPITRVDLRRMHALGLLNEDELQLRYEELGFSPDDAGLMTAFTVDFNADDDPETTSEMRDLTRAQIVKFFEEGLFSTADAIEQLEAIAFSPEDAATIIAFRQLDIDRDLRELSIRVIRQNHNNRVITTSEAIDALNVLELPPVRHEFILTQLETERQSQVKLPSLAHLTKFFKKDIIEREEYEIELERLGYPAKWVARYADLAEQIGKDDDITDE